jgi:hypothetical protein
MLVALAAVQTGAQTALQNQPLEKLTVKYGFECNGIAKSGVILTNLTGSTLGHNYSKEVPYDASLVTVPVDFSVVPDKYHIQGFSGQCSLADSEMAIVLPGHPTIFRADLSPCCGLATPGPNVAGFVEPGLHVEMLDEAEGVACSGHVDRATLKAWPVQRDGDAYYSGDALLAFGDSHSEALVRITNFANLSDSMWGDYARFDVTHAALRRNASPGGSVIRCLPAPAPSP